MKFIHIHSKLGSILFSTFCIVAFGFLTGPVIPASYVSGGVEVRGAAKPETVNSNLWVPAGKAMIMESSARIIRASIANPDLAGAVSLDDHELLLNGRTPGRTNVTLWQEDGTQRRFDLYVERRREPASLTTATGGPALTAAYQDAMARVQTAITGAKR
jgi:Flp pilus assembly secretin CpaC